MPFREPISESLFLDRAVSRHHQAIDNSRQFDTVETESSFHSPCSPDPNCLPRSKNSAMSRNPIWFAPPAIVSTKKDGSERLNFTAFYEAMLEAKGVSLGDGGGSGGNGRPGRSLSFNTKIQFNGNLLVGKAYTAQLGLKPGDEFEIKLGRKQIKLIPLGAAAEE